MGLLVFGGDEDVLEGEEEEGDDVGLTGARC